MFDWLRSLLGQLDETVFLSTFIGTLLGALVAVSATVIITWRERPRPVFAITEEQELFSSPQGIVSVAYTIANVGDGAAYGVAAKAVGTEFNEPRSHESLLKPGEAISAQASYKCVVVDTDSPIRWPKSPRILVEWRQPPRREKHQATELPVSPPVNHKPEMIP